jgi:hypothetical protein
VHRPVILDAVGLPPDEAPKSLDGTDQVLFLGVLPGVGAVRSMQIRMGAGRPLRLEMAIPDAAPERDLALDELPTALLMAPDGRTTGIVGNLRIPSINPGNGESHLVLRVFETFALAGTYSVLVCGRAPCRFAIAHGMAGNGFHGIDRGSVATAAQVASWYAEPAELGSF